MTGGFFFAPDHDYPSFVELRLTVTDSGGLTDVKSRVLDPNTVALTFASVPSGLELAVGPSVDVTPFSRTVIVGSANSVAASSPQLLGGTEFVFSSWSDGGEPSHLVQAPAAPASYTASFVAGCAAGTVSCNDGNACTTDTCDPLTGCLHANNTLPCNDGSACTTGDVCQGGTCGGTTVGCNDGNPCTDDGCNPASGCTHTPNTAACNDGSACTTGDVCQAGTCVGTALGCGDGNPCTDDGCNPASGCTHTPNTAACNDGSACTTGDVCQAGTCTGTAVGCDDGNPCTTDGCTPATGCTHTPNTAPCDDGSSCTTGDACQAGACTGTAVGCDDGNPCTTDGCDPATGCTHTPNAAPCDDGNACTTGDVCQAGACAAGSLLSCDDGNACTEEICDASVGCLYAFTNTPCGDGNTCTTGDVCQGGTCVGGSPGAGCLSCDAVATIPATGGTFAGTTSGAGTLSGSCGDTAASPERVFRWTPAVSGIATISTCGTGTTFDTIAYLRTGCATGAELTCNDDTIGCGVADGTPNASRHGSRLQPAVTAGQTYYIVVDGWAGAQGAFSLTVDPPHVCGNGVREGPEACDGTDDAACPSGQCSASCTCVPPAGGLADLVPAISDLALERECDRRRRRRRRGLRGELLRRRPPPLQREHAEPGHRRPRARRPGLPDAVQRASARAVHEPVVHLQPRRRPQPSALRELRPLRAPRGDARRSWSGTSRATASATPPAARRSSPARTRASAPAAPTSTRTRSAASTST